MNKDIVTKAAKLLGLPTDYVWEVYKTYWAFVRNYISNLELKENITKEEFSKLKTSINIPSLGKFYIDWDYLQAKKKENERHKNKSIGASVHDSNNDS